MATNTQDPSTLPLQEIIVHNTNPARAIEFVYLSLLVSALAYRVVYFKDQDQYVSWLLAFLCELLFTFIWVLSMRIKWNQCTTKTYPERLLNKVSESEFPAMDIFVTTADPILEPAILTMNTVLSLLAVDYPADKLALYLSDDGCSPFMYYSLVETTKFAKLWVPFCKKYNVQLRAPFKYFKSTPSEDDPMEFKEEWTKMKKEYGDLYNKIDVAAQRPFPCDDDDSDFAVFQGVHRSDHPTIIKIISENKEGSPTDLPHVIYLSREKSPKHPHNYKAGAMNVLARVSGVMTNAPLMLNVDCDMFVNNPQVCLHTLCMVLGFKKEDNYAFFQYPQAYYDALKDDPFGNIHANLAYIGIGMSSGQGTAYTGTNCFHRRDVMYGSSPKKSDNISNEDLHKIFGKSTELRESAAQILSESNSKTERRNPSDFIEAAIDVASCSYEYGTSWGKQIGWLYGSTTEDLLTALGIQGRGWRSASTVPDPMPFLGCAPTTYPASLVQLKRWIMGLFEILFTDKNPILLTIKADLWFERACGYLYFCLWPVRSVFEICYACLPAYCLITGSHFLPKVNERAFLVFASIFVFYILYGFWECRHIGVSVRMWWNLQRMVRVNAVTAWFFGFLTVIMKLTGLSKIAFEVTQKDHKDDDGGGDDDKDDEDAGRFTYDESPVIVPGVVILLVNIAGVAYGVLRLLKVDYSENRMGVLGLGFGELFCSVWLLICFWEYFKGLFGKGKYGIPSSTISKSGALALVFVLVCRRSSQQY